MHEHGHYVAWVRRVVHGRARARKSTMGFIQGSRVLLHTQAQSLYTQTTLLKSEKISPKIPGRYIYAILYAHYDEG